MNAVAMESANRAYVQQTLNRLKDIATGQAPVLPKEEETNKNTSKNASKTSTRKNNHATGIKAPVEKKTYSTPASSKSKKPAGAREKAVSATSSVKKKKAVPKE